MIMTNDVSADILNQICAKELSTPWGLSRNTAAEVSAALTVPHRIVAATDRAAILRESNSYVVVLDGVDALSDADLNSLLRIMTGIKWRKALLVPFMSDDRKEQPLRRSLRMINHVQ
jgi:hypothetical protein